MTPEKTAQVAAMQAANRARSDERITELEWLVEGGVPLEFAIPRVGWTLRAAARALARRNHPYRLEAHRLVGEQRRAAA